MKSLLKNKDVILGILSIALGVGVSISGMGFNSQVSEKFRTDPVGPGPYVCLLGAGILLCGIVILIQGLRQMHAVPGETETKEATIDDMIEAATTEQQRATAEEVPADSGKGIRRLWTSGGGKIFLTFVALFVYWYVAGLIGYLIPSVLFAVFEMCLLNAKNWKRVALAAALAIFPYFLFYYGFDIPLDRGTLL
ncbi:MAG: tripartite tricarboxylate transporter TctB family protein [Lachnospiraceae bacterium]|nr:tripartite tricarboxylate transporter TctB family protein [Lachnospiraceae bacterium]